ncbi:MAG: DNA polymerase III subunit delta [Bacteroidales bacterium]|nr:DNA polymerase III subunit delta [Bacteroidales bacterium]HPD94750.1 DNA polymerase III subunit delta [Tenuifilaceae bacterium]HRX32456.1 DNA polymerase III subunit delta [Tenuifilaceae bacterium]
MAKKSTLDSFNQIIEELKNKIFKPIYFLIGDEAYYIDKISDFIAENVLNETDKAFNQTIVYGRDVSIADIINNSRRFPMTANNQVVIVKEAQNVKNLSELEIYLKAPQPTTLLVICYKEDSGKKAGSKITSMGSQIRQKGVYFESKRLYDYQIPDWIVLYLSQKNIKIDVHAATLLTEYLGNDLSKIANELEKLIITLPEGNPVITAQNVEKNIGISKEFNRFELTKALGEKDSLKAFRIADYFAHNPNSNPYVLTISAIHQYFLKIFKFHYLRDKGKDAVAKEFRVHPFFVNEYINAAKRYPPKKCFVILGLLREYDMRGKGVNNNSTDHGELLRELIFKILN